MSTITVDGRLVADPDLRFTPSGRAVAKLTVAENHRRKDGDQWVDDGASFWDVTVWGKRAENLADLTKGTPVLATGTPRIREFERKDGTKGRSVEITATTVAIVPTGQPAQHQQPESDPWATGGAPF